MNHLFLVDDNVLSLPCNVSEAEMTQQDSGNIAAALSNTTCVSDRTHSLTELIV